MTCGSSVVPDACVACGSVELTPFVTTRRIALRRCRICRGLTAFPRPARHALIAGHDCETYFSHPYFEHRRVDRDRADERCRDVFNRVQNACSGFSLAGARHLDVGCDTGVFLEAFARRYGTLPVGIDVAARAVALAQARGIEAYHGELSEASSGLGEFALVTLIDVIEHVADPVQLLRDVRARLRDGGICYLETPNIRSIVYGIGRAVSNLTGGRPAWLCERLFLPEHVQYLSVDGLTLAARAADLRVIALTRRSLRDVDVNAAAPIQAAVQSMQLADRLLGREILHCAVLAR